MAHILIISHEFPPTTGGAGSVASTLADVLSKQHNVVVLTSFKKRRVSNPQKYKLIQVNYIPVMFSLLYLIKIRLVLKTRKFDRIIINDIGASQVASFFFTLSELEKCAFYFHGNEVEEILNKRGLIHRVFKERFVRALSKINKLIFVSEFLKTKFFDNLNDSEGLKNKSVVIYNGISNEMFYPVLNNLFNPIKESNKQVLLTVCRIVKEKGLDHILNLLIQNKDRYHWVLIGDGNYLPELKRNIAANHLTNNFTHIHSMDRSQLKYYYSAADFFILLSDFEESFGLVYIEANACGLPVIAQNKGGTREAVFNNVNGYLLEPFQTFPEKFDHKFEKNQLIEFSKKFNVESMKLNIENHLL